MAMSSDRPVARSVSAGAPGSSRRASHRPRSVRPRSVPGPSQGLSRVIALRTTALALLYAHELVSARTCPRNWTSGCRCGECRRRLREGAKVRHAVAAVRRGQAPGTRVPPDRARRQLDRLRAAGLSMRAISARTGVSVGALQHLQQRDRRHVALTTQQRLAAVVP